MNKPLDFRRVSLSKSDGRNERWRSQFLPQTDSKMKGGAKIWFLENLSLNLCTTFQKCALYTRKVFYYHTLKSKGGTSFAPPCATFAPPFGSNEGYISALKYLQKSIFVPPFKAKSSQMALQAASQIDLLLERWRKVAQNVEERWRIELYHLCANQEVIA